MFHVMASRSLRSGDWVVFASPKHSVHPGPRARDIRPEPSGEGYLYFVDKFWLVTEMRGNQVVLKTRRGKIHIVNCDDPNLRLASWWERLVCRNRFPRPEDPEQHTLVV